MVIAKMPNRRYVFVKKSGAARKMGPELIKAAQMLEDFELRSDQKVLPGKAGDYIVAEEESKPIVLPKKVFEKTYERLTIGSMVYL